MQKNKGFDFSPKDNTLASACHCCHGNTIIGLAADLRERERGDEGYAKNMNGRGVGVDIPASVQVLRPL